MAHTLKEWLGLVRGYTATREPGDAEKIAQACAATEARGETASVWHEHAKHYDKPCMCCACLPREPLPQGRRHGRRG